MNVVISDALFTDPCGNEFYYDLFFIKERNIRYIHLPEEVRPSLPPPNWRLFDLHFVSFSCDKK